MLEAAKRRSASNPPVVGATDSRPHENEVALRFQQAVAELGQLVLDETSPELLFRVASVRVTELLSADLVAVMEIEDGTRLRLRAGTGLSEEGVGSVIVEWDPNSPPAFHSLISGPALDEFFERDLDTSVPHRVGAKHVSAKQILPIGRSDSPLGVLVVFMSSAHEFKPLELTFLRSVSQIIAGAINRARIEGRLRREAEERAILGEIARIIGSSLEIDKVYSLFADQVRRLVIFDRITINLIDQETNTYHNAYVAGVQLDTWEEGVQRPIVGMGVEAVIRSRAGMIVQDEEIEDFRRRYPGTKIGDNCGLFSMLTVPVFWQGEVIGTLAIRAFAEKAYSNRDLQLLGRVAAQIAGSLANSTLHARQKEYAHEQATLAEISRAVASSVQLNEIYPKFAEAVRKLIPFDRIAINTVDEENGTAQARYVWGKGFPGSSAVRVRPLKGSATGAVTEARAGMIISAERIRQTPDRFAYLKPGLDVGLISTLAVPVISRGSVVGSLMLRSLKQNAYSQRDLTFAERVAAQISGAVRNAHLNELMERAGREQALLADLGRATIQARDLTGVFDHLNNLLPRCIDFDRIAILVHDPDRSILRFEYVRGVPVPRMAEGDLLRRPPDLAANVAWSDDTSSHNGESPRDGLDRAGDLEAIAAAGLRSWLQVPLMSRDRLIGIISLRSKRENAYILTDLRLLERVAAQVAPAVDNVRFYYRAKQATQHQAALDEMIRAFSQTRVQSELLAKFKSQIREAIPAQSVSISSIASTFDQLASEFNDLEPSNGVVEVELTELNRTLTDRVVESAFSLIVDCDVEEQGEPESPPDLVEALTQAGYQSSLSVPLLSAGDFVGVLHFHSRLAGGYFKRDRNLAEKAGLLLTNTLLPLHLIGADTAEADAPAADGRTQRLKSVVLVDSEAVCRQTTRASLQSMGVPVAAESYSMDDCAPLMQASGARMLVWEIHKDDVVDFSIISSLLEVYPDAGVVIVDNGCGPTVVCDSLRSGARGVLLKDTPADRMADALKQISAGGTVLDPGLIKSYFERMPVYRAGSNGDTSDILEQLGERDLAILQAVSNGQSNAEIAAELSFAVGTIKNRLARIYKVLGVSDRAGAMAFAIRAGIVA